MQTTIIPQAFQHISPAGAEVRLLMSNNLGGIAHCTLRKGVVCKAITHKTVSEFWYILSGLGEIWRKQNEIETITSLTTGVTIEMAVGTHFQYRSSIEADLIFICTTMPPWPGTEEVRYIKGIWEIPLP
jgi:mannose-6-phosphate isomerase-like protein (cupin superfamily)